MGLLRLRGSYTSERTLELILKTIDAFGLEEGDIVGITTDGAATMIKVSYSVILIIISDRRWVV